MASRKRIGKTGGLMRKVRKPIPPPTRVEEDPTKYQRTREKERLRRLEKSQ
ncbi:MAG TPA: hypothetical protein VMH37_01530 [Candidatus Binataceae bacterium]|nr:hypothetical protein [Candidatus Binataceae bacterium]